MDPLQSLDDDSLTPLQQAILHMLKGALQYPASKEARVTKIVNDIVFCCQNFNSPFEVGGIFSDLWDLVIRSGCRLPSGHEWQDILVSAIDTILHRDGVVVEDEPGYIWSDLPDLDMYLSEHWQRKPEESRMDSPWELHKWKNINSFISRLGSSGYEEVLNLGTWEIRTALEDTVTESTTLLNCRVWIAAEWIIRCNKPLFRQLTHPADPNAEPMETWFTGPLYGEGLPPWTLERWEFWKKRFTVLAKDSESLGLEDETKKHIEKALEVMT